MECDWPQEGLSKRGMGMSAGANLVQVAGTSQLGRAPPGTIWCQEGLIPIWFTGAFGFSLRQWGPGAVAGSGQGCRTLLSAFGCPVHYTDFLTGSQSSSQLGRP